MTAVMASASFLALGMLYFRTGRGPAALAVIVLLHLRALGRCTVIALAKAVEVYRVRYRECYQDVLRETGR